MTDHEMEEESMRDRSRSPVSPRKQRDLSPAHPAPTRDFDSGRRGSFDRRKVHDEVTEPSSVLGVFGLSMYTKEKDLEEAFGKYGSIEKCLIVMDTRSDRSRGFGFITFASIEDASKAKEALNGTELHDRKMRVDFSKTKEGHAPTPGQYAGERRPRRDYDRGPPRRDRYDDRRDRYDDRRSYDRRDRYDDRRSYDRRDAYDDRDRYREREYRRDDRY